MAIIGPPPNAALQNPDGRISIGWANFFSTAGQLLAAMSQSGTTAQRPTAFLFVGRVFFDTTLGYPVWLRSIGPVVWVDATGAPA